MQGCAVALTAAACLGLVILISGMVAEVLGDIRDRRRREETHRPVYLPR